jgi:hypothetical protein
MAMIAVVLISSTCAAGCPLRRPARSRLAVEIGRLRHRSRGNRANALRLLYPMLRWQEERGLLTSEWRLEGARNKRFYKLSPGRRSGRAAQHRDH